MSPYFSYITTKFKKNKENWIFNEKPLQQCIRDSRFIAKWAFEHCLHSAAAQSALSVDFLGGSNSLEKHELSNFYGNLKALFQLYSCSKFSQLRLENFWDQFSIAAKNSKKKCLTTLKPFSLLRFDLGKMFYTCN